MERGRDREFAYKIQILVTKSVLFVIVFIDSSFLVSAVNNIPHLPKSLVFKVNSETSVLLTSHFWWEVGKKEGAQWENT